MCGVVIVAMAILLKNLGLVPSVYVGWWSFDVKGSWALCLLSMLVGDHLLSRDFVRSYVVIFMCVVITVKRFWALRDNICDCVYYFRFSRHYWRAMYQKLDRKRQGSQFHCRLISEKKLQTSREYFSLSTAQKSSFHSGLLPYPSIGNVILRNIALFFVFPW
jgi:hypothetical protein